VTYPDVCKGYQFCLSVCPSVVVLYLNVLIVKRFVRLLPVGITLVFEPCCRCRIPRGTPSAVALKTLTYENFAIFDRNLRLFYIERYEVDR